MSGKDSKRSAKNPPRLITLFRPWVELEYQRNLCASEIGAVLSVGDRPPSSNTSYTLTSTQHIPELLIDRETCPRYDRLQGLRGMPLREMVMSLLTLLEITDVTTW